jgi:hypothetical protein
MRKPAAILALLVGLLLVGSWFTMNYDDAKDAGANIDRGYSEISGGNDVAFQVDMAATEARHQHEIIFGVVGAAFLVAGLAIWPYGVSRKIQPTV